MLSQMTGYAGMADIRASQVLKWSIANKRDTVDEQELRSEVTTALLVTVLILPIVLIIGGIIIWYAPYLTQAGVEHYQLIRLTCSILILSLVINKVFSLFESVLRGMNLGFRRMGFRAGIVALGGGLKVLAVTQGYGIIGLSAVDVVVSLVTGFTFYYIVKQNIGWFGFGSTNLSKVVSYGKLSGWFMAFTGSKMLLLHSDKIVLGYIAGPVFVTKYAITMFASSALQGVVSSVVSGIIPGIGGLFGKQEYDKVIKARRIIVSLNWLLACSLGVAVVLLNESFIKLWIGEEHFAGSIENLLILFVAVQLIFFEIDSLIINVTLDMKRKVLYSSIASAITFLFAYFLVREYAIIGLCSSVLLGRFILTIGYPLILKESMRDDSRMIAIQMIQPFLTSALLLVSAAYLSQWVSIDGWIQLFAAGFATAVTTAFIFWFSGLGGPARKEVWETVSKIKVLKKE